MPVHQFIQDSTLLDKGLRNYWGYNTLAFFAPHATYAAHRRARPAGAGVQVDGQGDARRGHRGDPRRRLQPHRRGQPPRPDAELQGHRQPGVLPARRGRQALLHGLHRHRELPQRPAPALAAAAHGLPALLGHRDARRRLPVRPRLDAGPRVLRRRPALDVLRARAAGPGRQPGEADRRALGHRSGWLPGRRLPAAVDRVERRLPRHGARLLARRAVAGRVREPDRRVVRPLRALRPPAVRQHQLRHRPRRLHAARPGVLQREAQRGERRGQQGRREPQPVLEPRRRGTDRRPRDPRGPRARAAQLHRHAAAQPGRADAAARRRDEPDPERQQQHLRPGLRDQLGALGRRRPAADRVHRGGGPAAAGAPDLPPQALLHRRIGPRAGRRRRRPAQRHRLAAPRRPAHGAGRLGRRRAGDRDVPQRPRHRRPRPARPEDRRRALPALLQRRRPGRGDPAPGRVRRRVGGRHRHRRLGRGRQRPAWPGRRFTMETRSVVVLKQYTPPEVEPDLSAAASVAAQSKAQSRRKTD